MLQDDELIEAVSELLPLTFTGLLYRHTSPGFNPLSTEGARLLGGRWNPIGVRALYLGDSAECAYAEFRLMVQGQGGQPEDFPRLLHTVAVRELRVVDLTSEVVLRRLDLGDSDFEPGVHAACQRVAAAVYALGYQGLLAPSAAGIDLIVVAAYPDLAEHSALTLLASEDLHEWAAHRS